MIYTSGTTGKPKGALRTAAGDPAQGAALLALIGYTTDDVYITTGPLYHSGPGGFMGVAQMLGNTVVIQRKFDPADWLRLVDKYTVTSHVLGADADPDDLQPRRRGEREVRPQLDADHDRQRRAVVVRAEADVPRRLPGRVAVRGLRLDRARREHGARAEGPAAQARLVRQGGARWSRSCCSTTTATWSRAPGPTTRASCTCARPAVFADYYKQHDKYEADMRADFHTVGDIAYRDDEGYFYICDRKKDMIISGGMNIYPAEIEAALEQHPNIYDAAVFGIPSEEWGESVHAVVVVHPEGALSDADVDGARA